MIPKAQTARLDTLFGHGAAAANAEPESPSYDPFATPAVGTAASSSDASKRNAIPLHISTQSDDPVRYVVNPSVKRQIIEHLSDDAIRRRVMEEVVPVDFDVGDGHLETARRTAEAVLRLKNDLTNAPWMDRLPDVFRLAMVGALLRDDLAPGIYRAPPPENRAAELEMVSHKAEYLHASLLNAGYALVHSRFLPPVSRLFSAMAKVDQALLEDTQNCFTPAVRTDIAQRVVQVAATAGIFAGFARCPSDPETLVETAPTEAQNLGGGAMNTALAVIMKDLPKLATTLKPEAFPTILKNCENPATQDKVVARALEILEEDQWMPKINMVFRHLFPSDVPVNLSAVARIIPETEKAAPKKEDPAPC
jgi:hypothetical protein